MLTLDIIVVINWSFKFSRHLLLSILYVYTLELWDTFVDRGCFGVCCYLLIVQITASAILLTSLLTLNVVVVYWSFRFSLQILFQLLLCTTYTLLDHVDRFVNRVRVAVFECSDSRFSYYIHFFYVFSLRWSLEVGLLALDVVAAYWSANYLIIWVWSFRFSLQLFY